MAGKKKKSEKTLLMEKVQKLANRYARERDCFNAGGTGCISCGRWFSFSDLDGGHYLPATSQHSSTRFDERNINAQCHRCNRFLHANLRGYFRGLEKKLGRDGLDDLEASSGPYTWSMEELEQLAKEYKEKLNDIQRGILPPSPFNNNGVGMPELFGSVPALGGVPVLSNIFESNPQDSPRGKRTVASKTLDKQ